MKQNKDYREYRHDFKKSFVHRALLWHDGVMVGRCEKDALPIKSIGCNVDLIEWIQEMHRWFEREATSTQDLAHIVPSFQI